VQDSRRFLLERFTSSAIYGCDAGVFIQDQNGKGKTVNILLKRDAILEGEVITALFADAVAYRFGPVVVAVTTRRRR